MKSIGLILVAGGSGSRMGNKIAKQFISLKSKPILQHTIDAFLSWNKDIQIVLVLPENQFDFWNSIKDTDGSNSYRLCIGGKERFHSVQNGLKELSEVDYVMIHDGVRPFVSHLTLDRCINALNTHDSAIPVISPSESVRMIENSSSVHLDRSKIRLVQTPQCFHHKKLKEAYERNYETVFTDDASVFEKAGNKIHLVDGNSENIKITTPEDLDWARTYLKRTNA
jgi:2-C-methyl-D-erythritol 4-phosphate cytidylyltransferase